MGNTQKRRLQSRIKKLVAEYPNEVLHTLLDQAFWPEELNSNKAYSRISDDNSAVISVVFSHNGDAWPDIVPIVENADGPKESGYGLRFRTWTGGGDSLRVRNALLCLAAAIHKDNQTRPQNNRVHIRPE